MALSNYEKQKRWREKNRALYNFQQRNRRKKLSGSEKSLGESGGIKTLVKTEIESEFEPQHPSSIRDTTQPSMPFKTKKVGEFQMLVMPERVGDESTMPATKPLIFRDDNGRVISERAWNALQKLKEKAKENEYEIDDYIQ
jgi:hypothetical protein